jgi:hypothetical protein
MSEAASLLCGNVCAAWGRIFFILQRFIYKRAQPFLALVIISRFLRFVSISVKTTNHRYNITNISKYLKNNNIIYKKSVQKLYMAEN